MILYDHQLREAKFNIEEIWFKKFCNKYEKEETISKKDLRILLQNVGEKRKDYINKYGARW